MRMHFGRGAVALMVPLGVGAAVSAQDPPASAPPPRPATAWVTAVEPKPISPAVRKGLDWLVEHQLKDGGWGQGDEAARMGGGQEMRDRANVADTCVSALALIRSGSSPREGSYRGPISRAVLFVCGQVEASDPKALEVSGVKGTRVQAKLGPNIDTFLASLLLAEAKGRMGDSADDRRVDAALDLVLAKIKAHQKADGTFDNRVGWAPILAQSMAGKGINRAAQNGAKVADDLLVKLEGAAVAQATRAPAGAISAGTGTLKFGVGASTFGGGGLAGQSAPAADPAKVAAAGRPASAAGAAGAGPFVDHSVGKGGALVAGTAAPAAVGSFAGGGAGVGGASSFAGSGGGIGGGISGGGFAGGGGSAGVELYARASNLSLLQDSVNTNATRKADLAKVAETSKDEKEVARARSELERINVASLACAEDQKALVNRLDDKAFVAGFGSNGGEEFLSYMNIGESLVVKGGDEWKRWDAAMTANLGRVQDADGSWSGHHCITGKNFCTATALLVLMGDRTPVPAPANPATPAAAR